MQPENEPRGAYVLTRLFEHNTWANLTLLTFCEGLTDGQLSAAAPGGYGSIRDTLLHTIRAETGYVGRVTGAQPPVPMSREAPFPGLAALQENARWAGAELLKLALSAREDSLARDLPPRNPQEYKLADLAVQAITHSVEHRTQVAAVLTVLGMQPPDMSAWKFMEATGTLHKV